MKTLIGSKIKHYNKLLKQYTCIKPLTVFNILQGYINASRDWRCITFKEYKHYINYINRKYMPKNETENIHIWRR
jgi:hypothetical protein